MRIVDLNPPDATVAVTGISADGYQPTVVTLTVKTDDLVPIAQVKDVVPEKNPLKKDCSALMSRVPAFDCNNTVVD